MKLKLDENLGSACRTIPRRGHDVATVPEQQLASATDREVITACQAERRGLVTLDQDFANPLVFEPKDYAGIAVLRLPSRPTPDDLWAACRMLIAALSREDVIGKLWIVPAIMSGSTTRRMMCSVRGRGVLRELAARHTPLRRHVFRNTRTLLRVATWTKITSTLVSPLAAKDQEFGK